MGTLARPGLEVEPKVVPLKGTWSCDQRQSTNRDLLSADALPGKRQGVLRGKRPT